MKAKAFPMQDDAKRLVAEWDREVAHNLDEPEIRAAVLAEVGNAIRNALNRSTTPAPSEEPVEVTQAEAVGWERGMRDAAHDPRSLEQRLQWIADWSEPGIDLADAGTAAEALDKLRAQAEEIERLRQALAVSVTQGAPPMSPTPEQIALARKIVAAEISREPMSKIRLAECVAIATILEVTEMAAKYLGALRVGYERNGLNADRLGNGAEALRNWEHLK